MYKEPNNSPASQEFVKSNLDVDEVRFSAMGSCYTLSGERTYSVVLLDHNGEPIATKEKPRIGFI